ncbi:MAG: hypothetical protein HKP32_06520 [Woeseia sp.]|nr:hypothetical protein [Gammaproteobacteria bacterium]NNL49331.1 hypothetical protein [Woeseiaceae bacterium]NNL54788.1 hypothetical protein [Woeseia sp.]
MKKRTRILLGIYLGVGVAVYTIIKILAGGLGIIGFGGPAGEVLEFLIVILAWPLVIVLSVLVVMQGR